MLLNCIFSHDISVEKKHRLDDEEEEDEPDKKKQVIQEIPKIAIKTIEPKEIEEEVAFIPKVSRLDIPHDLRVSTIEQIYQKLHLSAQNAVLEEYKITEAGTTLREYEVNTKRVLAGEPVIIRSDAKFIVPQEVKPISPATMPDRKRYIQIIVDTLKRVDPNVRCPILHAVDEEYKIASTNSKITYPQSVKRKIHQLSHPEKYIKKEVVLSKAELGKHLTHLVIPTTKLIKFGYIMTAPKTVELVQKRTCRRCGADFTMAEHLKVVNCRFHAGKIRRKNKTTRFYDCCGAVVGEEGDSCSSNPYHIFYWSNKEEMHTAIPFQHITHTSPGASKAIGIDCEMGYSTLGFELLRITAIDFFTGEDVFDVMVKPKGTVVDLNTRYSGVSEIADDALTFDELVKFMRRYIDKNTILIGHGLENDMNAMRLIHDKIVDTAVLYPKYKATPTFRFSLKDLSFSYLLRNIQIGEHDSREDSIAAIDIVKYFINADVARAKGIHQ